MPFQPGQSGNPSGVSHKKPWAEAIRRALARREQTGNGATLALIAERLIDAAAEGELTALKELGDRLDGKPQQGIDVEANVRVGLAQILSDSPPA